MKARTLYAVVLFCLTVTTVFGQATVSIANDPPASREDIFKLFDVMQVRDQITQVMRQITVQMRSLNHEQLKKVNPNITADEMAKIDARSEQMIEAVPVNDMLDDMVPVYQKHLTKGDVDAMISFYSTPTGKKILREMPAMATEGMQALQPRLRKIMDETVRSLPQTNKPAAKETTVPSAPNK